MPENGNCLSPDEVVAMRETYIRTKSVSKTAQIHKTSRQTVYNYRKAENWDGIAKKRDSVVDKKAEELDIKRRVDDLEVVNNAIDLLSEDIAKKRPNIRRKLADLHSLITAKQLLTGKATGRQESNVIGRIEFVFVDENDDNGDGDEG